MRSVLEVFLRLKKLEKQLHIHNNYYGIIRLRADIYVINYFKMPTILANFSPNLERETLRRISLGLYFSRIADRFSP